MFVEAGWDSDTHDEFRSSFRKMRNTIAGEQTEELSPLPETVVCDIRERERVAS